MSYGSHTQWNQGALYMQGDQHVAGFSGNMSSNTWHQNAGSSGGGGNIAVYNAQQRNALPFTPQNAHGQSRNLTNYNSIGTVTKLTNDCGLINSEIFFRLNVCKGQIPKLGERVLFEANISNGEFKWDATRVQIMPSQDNQPPPLMGAANLNMGIKPLVYNNPSQRHHGRHASPRRHSPGHFIRCGERHGHRSDRSETTERKEKPVRVRENDDHDEIERKRLRPDSDRSRRSRGRSDKSQGRSRDRGTSPHRRERTRSPRKNVKKRSERSPIREIVKPPVRIRAPRRYMVQVPKSLMLRASIGIEDLKKFNKLYVPSDFFNAKINWPKLFTLENPLQLCRPSNFHIMHKIVEPLEAQKPEYLNPPDANYLYSVKVMLMGLPPLVDIYQKCFENDDTADQVLVHPTRLITFLVGTRGRNEPMAIGGPWSAALDGANPDKDPAVLIRTAIRTCKALTGVDLSNCTQWYRFMELKYHRSDHKNLGKSTDPSASPRIETVVFFLPDIYNCMPTEIEWQRSKRNYSTVAEKIIKKKVHAAKTTDEINDDTTSKQTAENVQCNDDGIQQIHGAGIAQKVDNVQKKDPDNNDVVECDDANVSVDCVKNSTSNQNSAMLLDQSINHELSSDLDISINTILNNERLDDSNTSMEDTSDSNKEPIKPTEFTQLDIKNMKLFDIRKELKARGLVLKGSRIQASARLAKQLNIEKEKLLIAQAKTVEKSIEILKESVNNVIIDLDDEETSDVVIGAAKNVVNKKKKIEDPLINAVKNDTKNAKKPEEKKKVIKKATDGQTLKKNETVMEHEENSDSVDMIYMVIDEYDCNKNLEEIPSEMDEKERKSLIRRYTLPEQPSIIVHPNKTAKSGKFDCSVMSLSTLLDYRDGDIKERFFEVSLFAELFNEMLIRDFGFKIYKELCIYKDVKEADEKKVADSVIEKDEKDVKDDGKMSVEAEKNIIAVSSKKDNNNDDSGEGSYKRKASSCSIVKEDELSTERKKTVIFKPELRLAFLYFDTTNCGFVFDKDIEDLISIIGLRLSRSQIRAVLDKVVKRQTFHYRVLTDREDSYLSPAVVSEDVDDISVEQLKKLSDGNNPYLDERVQNLDADNQNKNTTTLLADNNALINYNGAVVHIGKLLDQLKRVEKNYTGKEKECIDLRKQNIDLRRESSRAGTKVKDLQAEVKSLNRKITDLDQDLYAANRKSRDQNSALYYIYNRVTPFFAHEKSQRDRECDKEKEKDKDKEKEKEKSKGLSGNREKDDEKSVTKETECDKESNGNDNTIDPEKMDVEATVNETVNSDKDTVIAVTKEKVYDKKAK